MDTMGSMGHYRLYVALLQSPIDSPGFADVLLTLLASLSLSLNQPHSFHTLSLLSLCPSLLSPYLPIAWASQL
jgi:hypothetical protein